MKSQLTAFIAYSVTGLLGALVIANKPAEAVTLSSLEAPGASLTTGNLTFSNFTFSTASSSISASGIDVSPEPSYNGSGLQFSGVFSNPSANLVDAVIRYKVQDTAGAINGFKLSFLPSATASSLTQIDEGVKPINGFAYLGTATVTAANSSKEVNFSSPQSALDVTKDITIGPGGLSNQFSVIDQVYPTTDGPTPPAAVPEPSSVLSPLAFGALFGGYTLMRKRKQKMLLNLVKRA